MTTIIGALASVLVGGAVAAVTVIGIVNGQVSSAADSPANVNQPAIQYGTTK